MTWIWDKSWIRESKSSFEFLMGACSGGGLLDEQDRPEDFEFIGPYPTTTRETMLRETVMALGSH